MSKARVQYPLGVTPEMVRDLHSFYTTHTRRVQKLDARVESGWCALLDEHPAEDVQLVIRYLQKRVTVPNWHGPRHPGCLKLNAQNLFNLENFADDLSEAKAIMSQHLRRPKPPTLAEQTRTVRVSEGDTVTTLDPAQRPQHGDPGTISAAVKQQAEEFRQKMKGSA